MVISPNGNEDWGINSSQTITWSETIDDTDVSITLYKGGVLDSTTPTIVAGSASGTDNNNDGSYTWSVPSTQTLGTDYKIKICGATSTTSCDESNYNFSIVSPITVTSPNGGEEWSADSSYTITWSEDITDTYVSIKLYKNGAFDSNIDTSELNDGSYTWNISSSQAVASDYTVKICGTTNTSTCDESNSNFSISSDTEATTIFPQFL